ncbi:MAG: carbon-nitrogen hydrolase [Actinobacteria bacterium]|nr:carbon-nitrogen hydrolase [Actinomycetota bacterium]MBO0786474.1 carbon-nitrogen hydrolase [Actinomycetota bacterium]
MRVACCQLAPRVGEAAANRAACRAAAERAAAAGAQVVVLPELAVSGYVFDGEAEARALAEPAQGPTASEWAGLAGRLGITLVGGLCELGADGLLYNSAVVAADGRIQAVYRKAHLWDAEKLIFTPGSAQPPVIEAGGARLAVMICYDLEFPEWVRLPALAGAQLLCVPANWPRMPGPSPAGERPMEVVRAQAAAAVNRMFVAVCDRVGHERGVDWVGGSVVCDPDGWPLAGPAPADQEAMPAADCDLAAADAKTISDHNDVLADRRPSLYGGLLAGGRAGGNDR